VRVGDDAVKAQTHQVLESARGLRAPPPPPPRRPPPPSPPPPAPRARQGG